MYYKRFEDMKVWQDARHLLTGIYTLINSHESVRKDFSICDQLKRAGYSILLNIAEGFERKSKKEFANFLNIAKGSAGEVRSILYVVSDNHKVKPEVLQPLFKESEAVAAQLFNFRKFLSDK